MITDSEIIANLRAEVKLQTKLRNEAENATSTANSLLQQSTEKLKELYRILTPDLAPWVERVVISGDMSRSVYQLDELPKRAQELVDMLVALLRANARKIMDLRVEGEFMRIDNVAWKGSGKPQ